MNRPHPPAPSPDGAPGTKAATKIGPPILELTRIRLLAFFREPGAVFWVFVFPVLMGLALGFAFREKPPEKIPVGIEIGALPASNLAAVSRDPDLLVQEYADAADARRALTFGRIALLVEPGTPLRYRYDPTRPESRAARLAFDRAAQHAAGGRDPLAVTSELVREKGSRYIDFLLPGILGLNLMGTGMWGIGFSVLTSRIKKTLKLLAATPMRKRDYLASHLLGRMAFLVFEVPLILIFGVLVFGVPIRGSLASLAAVCVLGAISFSGIGLLTTARASTLETGSGLMNLVMIPMWLLSGSFFSADRFPKAIQPVIQALPLTALNNALRAIMLEGKSIAAVAGECAILAAWGIVSFAVALKIFRWQ
jgi:ABC-type polysaccharide/polyol phosphate export permease